MAIKKKNLFFLITLFLLSGCLNSKFYEPNQIVYDSPENYGLNYETVSFKSNDGTLLSGWFIKAVGNPIGTVIHFHGNYGNISYYLKQISWLPAEGFNVFTFDYRGYGKSEGTPERFGVYQDSVAAMEYITSKSGIDNANLFIFAQSLGGTNAVSLVDNNYFRRICAIAIESTFYSYRREAHDVISSTVQKKIGKIPCLSLQLWPVSFLTVSDSHSPGDYIDKVSPIPVLLIHCTDDKYVSHRHSELLYDKAKEPKELWIIEKCKHLKLFTQSDEYRKKLVEYFKNSCKR